jgi:preprotein translocase subunit SecA
MRWLERRIILDVVDSQWKDHLLSLDHLKEGIGLRGYGQKDPLVEFKKEAFILFEDMMARIDNETIRYLFHIQLQQNEQPPSDGARRPRPSQPPHQPPSAAAAVASAAARASEEPPAQLPGFAREMERRQQRQQRELQYQTGPAQAEAPKPVRTGAKVGRNDPCPCGSGKKYKRCHGA